MWRGERTLTLNAYSCQLPNPTLFANSCARDTDIDYQRTEAPLAIAMRKLIAWNSFWNPLSQLNPLRPLSQKYYNHVMNSYIRDQLENRFNELKTSRDSQSSSKSQRIKSVTALALEAYISENADKDLINSSKLDDNFARYAAYQIRLFLFAGHDTTASSLNYTFHLLSKNPEAVARVREEHDSVFGKNPEDAGDMLRQDSALVNQVPYTLAVIKETLRLFPAGGTMRQGVPGMVMTDPQGREFPIGDTYVVPVHQAIQMNPRVWPRPEEFLPERFLVDPDHELYPKPNAYRPFEHGPRNCIGQTLVFLEMRIALIMTMRTLEIRPAYDELDAQRLAKRGWLQSWLMQKGYVQERATTIKGERAYQVEKGSARPADEYPCRVSLVERG